MVTTDPIADMLTRIRLFVGIIEPRVDIEIIIVSIDRYSTLSGDIPHIIGKDNLVEIAGCNSHLVCNLRKVRILAETAFLAKVYNATFRGNEVIGAVDIHIRAADKGLAIVAVHHIERDGIVGNLGLIIAARRQSHAGQ